MYIHIKVKTGQKKEVITKLKEGHYEIHVKEKPKNNLANKRILEILKVYFKTEKVKIINGHKHPSKLISVN